MWSQTSPYTHFNFHFQLQVSGCVKTGVLNLWQNENIILPCLFKIKWSISSFGIMFLWCSLSWLLGFYQQGKIKNETPDISQQWRKLWRTNLKRHKNTKNLKDKTIWLLRHMICETELQLIFNFSTPVICWLVSGLTDQLFDLWNLEKITYIFLNPKMTTQNKMSTMQKIFSLLS